MLTLIRSISYVLSYNIINIIKGIPPIKPYIVLIKY